MSRKNKCDFFAHHFWFKNLRAVSITARYIYFFSSFISITSRPLKWPQLGHTRCGNRISPQLLQTTRFGFANESWARRRSRLPEECFLFGWGVMNVLLSQSFGKTFLGCCLLLILTITPARMGRQGVIIRVCALAVKVLGRKSKHRLSDKED